MIGYMISRIRNEKKVPKTELSRRTYINIGHITHIEKEERNPSHRALKTICRALEIPYQPLMFTYDKTFTKEHKRINMENHIAYDKVLAVSSLDSFIKCPLDLPSAALALKISDTSMQPLLQEGIYAYIEFSSPLDNNDIGIFEYDNKVIMRRFIINENTITLKPDNPDFPDITMNFDDEYSIIGKVIGTSTGLIF